MGKPAVAIFMGSESDRPILSKAAEALKALGVPFVWKVASAHRSPAYLHELVLKLDKGGVQVFMAGAGGAAHLAGVVASLTQKPVIGVPLSSKLNGLDSLLSTVQMPRGVPVATVAIDNAENAALLAAQILSLSDARLAKALAERRRTEAASIAAQGLS